jgi:HAD superfamily 5'-nucleotidase-like hydrolase
MVKSAAIKLFRGDDVEPASRVYINRNLKMDSITHLGFDMDHTLAVYADEAQHLAFDLALGKLVSDKGYPEEILMLKWEPRKVIRGLVIDKLRGNIIKLDHHKYVEIAYHGTRKMTRMERKKYYSRPGESYRPDTGDYYYLDTLFCLPEAYMYMLLVDYFDKRDGEGETDYKALYDDIRAGIDLVHRDGTLKSELIPQLEKYIVKDPMLPKVLHHFLKGGKKLFLLTNSEFYYTNVVMSYLLNDEIPGFDTWYDYFELIIVSAGKPRFFRNEIPLERPDPVEVGDEFPPEVLKKIYCKGDFRALEKEIGAKGASVMYFGDHTFGDVLKSKQTCGWRTVMIVKEMDEELSILSAQKKDKEHLEEMRKKLNEAKDEIHLLENQITYLRNRKLEYYEDIDPDGMKALDEEIAGYQELLIKNEDKVTELLNNIKELEEKLASGYNKYWGSLFKSSRRKSRFGDQIEDFACLYSSKVTNFCYYPTTKYFRIKNDLMAHERED